MGIILYEHNQETYEQMVKMFEPSYRVGIVQPTGTGKSFLFLKWIEDNQKDAFCVFSPSNEIFYQLHYYAEESNCPEILQNVRMITYQALLKMTNADVAELKPSKIIIDEFHRTGAEQWGPSIDRVLTAFPTIPILGASATPIRYLDHARDMAAELFDRNLAAEITLGEAIRRKILPSPNYISVWYDIDGISTDPASSRQLDENDEKMYQTICRQLENSYGIKVIFKKYMPVNGKFIVFCRDVEHIKQMEFLFQDWLADFNESIHFYVSISANCDKEKQLQAFREDNSPDSIKLLFTVDRLNEGVHVRGIDGVIMLRPTDSLTVYMQQMGRALSSGAKKPYIFDMVNNFRNAAVDISDPSGHPFIRDFVEHGNKKDEEVAFKIFEKPIDFNKKLLMLQELANQSLDAWMQTFNLLVDYVEVYETFPHHKTIYKGINLGYWCDTQKAFHRQHRLNQERYTLLNSIGFWSSTLDAKWERKKDIAGEYIEEFGSPPEVSAIYKDEKIGIWWQRQKREYKEGTLRKDRMDKLIEIYPDFCNMSLTWNDRLQLLSLFERQHHRFPRKGELAPNGFAIGNWYYEQLRNYKAGKLSKKSIEKLESIGVNFENPYNISPQKTVSQ